MVRGRKPIPTAMHVLNGNPSKKNLDTREPRPKPIRPPCPAWLSAEAKRAWKQLVPQLERAGVLTVVDGQALAAVCQSYAIWVECEKFFKEHPKDPETGKPCKWINGRTFATPNGYIMPRPEVAIANKALDAFKAFATEFGLTPSSRSRIHLETDRPEEDPMEALLKKRGG